MSFVYIDCKRIKNSRVTQHPTCDKLNICKGTNFDEKLAHGGSGIAAVCCVPLATNIVRYSQCKNVAYERCFRKTVTFYN